MKKLPTNLQSTSLADQIFCQRWQKWSQDLFSGSFDSPLNLRYNLTSSIWGHLVQEA